MLKLTRTLPVSLDGTTKPLTVVRVLATQQLTRWSVDGGPGAHLASEQVEVIVRAPLRDYLAFIASAAADPVPHATVQFGEVTVEAMVKPADQGVRRESVDEILLTLLLLRVPVSALEFDDEWERDEEWCYSGEGSYVTAMRPTPRIEVYGVAPDGRGEWKHIGWSDTGVQFGDPH